jgi:hypothetical protein
VQGLIRLFLLEMGTHALFGSHFVLHNGFRQLRIHTDGGGELNSAAVDAILLAFGLGANVTSTPHTQSSNCVSELHIQTLVRDVIALLARSGLPKRLWHYAMRHACSMRNRVASQRVESDGVVRFVSTFELFYGLQLDVKFGWRHPTGGCAIGWRHPTGGSLTPCFRKQTWLLSE